ncbi:aromatic ring-hydroxylating dioxygenase subunit alpha [Croceicoccus bisphenolivorans]|uniref:aromatic ring-hydroxylating dioxygenase subunit alpha n=1 Tax=Croceicoccus bisphenolivorans TaxID=1783232 RepID=UPI00082F01BF|nr:aromatic ring-hydroxylating dioxygenase subunit alpha [Croceicoccus bisphenolivorans]
MTEALAHYWHPVAMSEEVTAKPARFRLLGEPLVLFRDDEGPVALSDLCIHRGAALSLGWLTDGRITCPYHGWHYDRSGTCVKIPSVPDGRPIPAKARTNSYRAQEAYGLVWVAMKEPIAPLPNVIPWDEAGYHRTHIGTWTMQSSAGRVIENSLDFSHFAWSHEGVLGVRDACIAQRYDANETEYGLYFEYVHTIPASSPITGGTAQNVHMTYDLTLPYSLVSCQTRKGTMGEHTWLFLAACPIDDRTSRIYHFQFRNHDLHITDETIRAFALPVIEEDRVIIESQRPEEIPLNLREELHIKLPDTASILYRRLLARAGLEREGS